MRCWQWLSITNSLHSTQSEKLSYDYGNVKRRTAQPLALLSCRARRSGLGRSPATEQDQEQKLRPNSVPFATIDAIARAWQINASLVCATAGTADRTYGSAEPTSTATLGILGRLFASSYIPLAPTIKQEHKPPAQLRDADPHLHPRCHHNDDWTETTNHNNETNNKTVVVVN